MADQRAITVAQLIELLLEMPDDLVLSMKDPAQFTAGYVAGYQDGAIAGKTAGNQAATEHMFDLLEATKKGMKYYTQVGLETLYTPTADDVLNSLAISILNDDELVKEGS